MPFTVENIVVVLSIIMTEAWFLHGYFSGKPEFEPAIAFLVALGALFSKDKIKDYFNLSDKSTNSNNDLDLFNEFQRVFPAEPTLRLLKEADFGGSIRKADIHPLYDFVETWDSVEKEFLNKKLENEKKDLYKAANKLAGELVKRTVPIGNGDYISVFPDDQRGGPRSKHIIKDAQVLNKEARLFVPKYEAFVRKCRASLKS